MWHLIGPLQSSERDRTAEEDARPWLVCPVRLAPTSAHDLILKVCDSVIRRRYVIRTKESILHDALCHSDMWPCAFVWMLQASSSRPLLIPPFPRIHISSLFSRLAVQHLMFYSNSFEKLTQNIFIWYLSHKACPQSRSYFLPSFFSKKMSFWESHKWCKVRRVDSFRPPVSC